MACRQTTPKSKCLRVELTLCLPNKRKGQSVDSLAGLQEGGDDLGGAFATELMLSPEPDQESQLAGPHCRTIPGAQVTAEGTQTSPQESQLRWEWLLVRQASRGLHRQTPSDFDQHCLASGPTSFPKEGIGHPSRMGFYSL